MARLARVIASGMPHHVTQRGNRRQQTFFGEEDYQHYLELISRFCRAEQVAIWAYCLMPNHVPLIVVSQSAESLRRVTGEAHRRYTRKEIRGREAFLGSSFGLRIATVAPTVQKTNPVPLSGPNRLSPPTASIQWRSPRIAQGEGKR